MKKTPIFVLLIVIVGSTLFFVTKWHKESQSSFLKTEINDKDYFSLLVKYNYVKGSKQGNDFKSKLKHSLSDKILTRAEYQKITGDEASISVYESDENKELYKTSKNQLISLINE